MNINDMMQQAKAMQEKMKNLQDEIAQIMVEGTSGGGLITVIMKCNKEMVSINIDPSVIVATEKEMLEDLVKAAINDAMTKADDRAAQETKNLMGDMGLPAGMDLPF